MKFRSDFVTNSSSSSFVIAFKDLPNVDDEILKRYPFINMLMNLYETIIFSDGSNSSSTTEGVVCASVEKLEEYFMKNYNWFIKAESLEKLFEQRPKYKTLYDSCVEHISKGYRIIFKEIDYSDDILDSMINAISYCGEYLVILKGNQDYLV